MTTKTTKVDTSLIDTEEDLKLQRSIVEKTDFYFAILGKAFIRHGSGHFLNIRATTR